MKKTLYLAVTALFAMALAVTAQPEGGPPSPEQMAKMETEQMKSGLNLNADQLAKVEAINLKYAQKMGEMFQQGPPSDFAEMQKKMEEINTQKRAEFAEFLSDEQMKKYDEMMAERRQRGPGGPPPM
jgi:Spy/CpxP family protein refolding chaperone